MIRIPDELFEKGEWHESSAPPVFASELAEARQAAALTRAGAESSLAIHDLDRAVDESTADPANWADNFLAEAQRLRDDHLATLPDPRLGEAFARDFDDLAAAKLAIVRRRAAAREVEDARAHLDETLDAYAGFAVDASSDIEAQIVHDQAEDSIARMEQAGYLYAGEADELRQSYAARQDTARLDRLMETAPDAAAEALGDPTRFLTLEPDARLRLRDRAQIRAEDQERAAAAATFSERNGRVAALIVRLDADEADRADIMQAVSDGWLRPAERDRALALWNRRRDEIRQRTDAISRAAAALAGEGTPLDPSDSGDRAAIDIHFDDVKAAWLAAGLNEEQLLPLIADYVGAAGILPNGVRRDIAGGFRTGDPQARVRTADLIGQLPREALKDIPQRDGAEALLILALQQTGWPPDQAADRAASIMAGTVDLNDRFFVQDSAAIATMISPEARQNVQVASLQPNKNNDEAGTAVGVSTDAVPPKQDGVQVAVTDVVDLAVLFGIFALASLYAAQKASEKARNAQNQLEHSGEGAWPPQPLPPPSPLPTKEEAPPQPDRLPNIPPAQPSGTEELIPETIENHALPGPPIKPAEPEIYIFDPPPAPVSDILEDRKGNELTKAEIDHLRDRILAENPGWTHVHGGRRQDTGEELSEYRHAGSGYAFGTDGKPGDGRKGSHYADLTFRNEKGELVHYQHASVDKNGKPTAKELENAMALAQPHYVNGKLERPQVYIVVKQWQLSR
jgi:hypothetical protein